MLKFFRKYNKHMLAVFMALLLIVWLTDESLRRILSSDRTNEAVAKAFDGTTIRQADLIPTYRQTQVLGSLFGGLFQWQTIWQVSLAEQGIPYYMVRIDREPLSEKEWYMLVQTARRRGIGVTAEEINRLKASLRDADRRIEGVRNVHRVSLDAIDAAIADFLRVREAASREIAGVHITEADVRSIMKRIGEKVRVKYLALPTASFEDRNAPIDEAEIRAHFEQYKDVPRGGAAGKPYGYQKEPAVQFQYVKADVARIAATINIDEMKAWEYWRDHKDEFKRPVPVSQPAPTGTQPAPAPRTEMKPYDHFDDEVKAKVIARLRDDQAKTEALRLIRDFVAILRQDWAKAATGADGYPVAPDVVRQSDYLGRHVDAFARRKYGDCLELVASPWRARSEIFMEKGISGARVVESRQPLNFSQAVFQVQGLADRKSVSSASGDEYYLSLFEPCPSPLTDGAGNAYVYRVVAVRPAAPPSLDEVREQVVEDLRAIKADEAAEAAARKLAARSADVGLDAALAAEEGVRVKLGPAQAKVETPDPFAREELPRYAFGGSELQPTDVPGIGRDASFIRECFRLGEATTTTQPQRVGVVKVETPRRWVVVQWVENVPLRQDEYDEKRPQVVMMLRIREVGEFVREYYSPEQIRKRAQWEDVTPKGAASPAEPQEALF